MSSGGRPRYPDILTPRQWEVLKLLREGLTNEQIAERLGITLDGAKFHVSENFGRRGGGRPDSPSWAGRLASWPGPSGQRLRERSRSPGLWVA